ncbi:MAG: serine hydrolase [Candidatus Pacebacteria bacterium]|nr:serine hydrolase [Candidatus Paceibacterota bacterium]
MSTPSKKWLLPASFLGVFIIGGVVGYLIKQPKLITSQSIRDQAADYTFIHPLLAVSRSEVAPSSQYEKLSHDVDNYIGKMKLSDKIDTASVYFINYKTGGSFLINTKEQYMPASLMKVVIMIAYLKLSETKPDTLSHRLRYTEELDTWLSEAERNTKSELAVGKSYTVEYLIDKMIGDSDNGATNLLITNINESYLQSVYKALGIKNPNDDPNYTISTNDYSLFFRILFNATYLSPENSEKALTVLSKATYTDGLVAGLPTNTLIAHKFGQHFIDEGGTIAGVELHDCGIIYTNPGPYLLCVMTKGKTVTGNSEAIAGISKIVAAESIEHIQE